MQNFKTSGKPCDNPNWSWAWFLVAVIENLSVSNKNRKKLSKLRTSQILIFPLDEKT